jgi:hypothetical protein
MSLAARSPRYRKSLSLHDSNKDNVVLPSTSISAVGASGKGRKGVRMSFAGEGMSGASFALGKAASAKPAPSVEMSPRKIARRSLVRMGLLSVAESDCRQQPRKSILKGLPGPSSPKMQRSTSFPTDIAEEVHAHTISFNLPITANADPSKPPLSNRRQSLSRRVSFAATAHVR